MHWAAKGHNQVIQLISCAFFTCVLRSGPLQVDRAAQIITAGYALEVRISVFRQPDSVASNKAIYIIGYMKLRAGIPPLQTTYVILHP